MTRHPDQVPEIALAWHRAGKGAALATVVETWGSAPRRTGSQLVVSADGEMAGSVSGGCVEGAVVAEAMAVLETGKPVMLEYGVSDDQAFAAGLACGGRIRVNVEPVGTALPVEMLEALVAARAARQAIGYAVTPETGARRLVAPSDPNMDARFRADKSGFDGAEFVAIFNPPFRVIIVGAVHIAQVLVPMVRLAGFDPVLVDPRSAFGAAARFPGEPIVDEWPDDALTTLGLDPRSAVVTLTHDPKLDDPAIRVALASDALYLGCLGSSRTHAKRVERLRAEGFSDAQIARIQAPVGLDIGAQGPAEIAVSILAQIVQRLRRG